MPAASCVLPWVASAVAERVELTSRQLDHHVEPLSLLGAPRPTPPRPPGDRR